MLSGRENGRQPAVAPLQEGLLGDRPLTPDGSAGGSESDGRLAGSADAEAPNGWNLSASTAGASDVSDAPDTSDAQSIRPQSPELVGGLMRLLDREEAQGSGLGQAVRSVAASAATLPQVPFVPPLELGGLRHGAPPAPATHLPGVQPLADSPAGHRRRANALGHSDWRGVMEQLAAQRLASAAGAPGLGELGAISSTVYPSLRPGAAGRARGPGSVPSLPLDPLPALSQGPRGRVAQVAQVAQGGEAGSPSQARGSVGGGSRGADQASGPSLPPVARSARASGPGLGGPS